MATPSGDNEFTFQYLTANNYAGNTVGIQDHTRTDGLTYTYWDQYPAAAAPIATGRAIRFEAVLVEQQVTRVTEPSAWQKEYRDFARRQEELLDKARA